MIRKSPDRVYPIWWLFVEITNLCNFHCTFCPDEIMERLQISRGNANMNLRSLVDWQLVYRAQAFSLPHGFRLFATIESGWYRPLFAAFMAEDNCDPDVAVSFDEQTVSGDCAHSYTLVRTWTATDDCGNTATCVQNVTVDDNTPPQITCPSNRSFECEETIVFGQATATDNCDPDPVITYDDLVIPGDCPYQYTIQRTWVATDACGNAARCGQFVNISDNTSPTITCAEDKRIGCNEEVVFDRPIATDNCDPSPSIYEVSGDVVPGPGPCEESHFLVWRAEDKCGNSSETCQQTIIRVLDNDPPVLTANDDKVLECNMTVVRRAIGAGAEVIILGDDYASNLGPLMSPACFEHFILPRLAKMIDMIHEEGALCIKHTDGNIMPIIDQLVDANPHALEFARANAHLNGCTQLTVQRLDWQDPQPEGEFDTIVGSEVVYKDQDIDRLLALFVNCLKPQGHIILVEEMRRTLDPFFRHLDPHYRISINKKVLRAADEESLVLLIQMHPRNGAFDIGRPDK